MTVLAVIFALATGIISALLFVASSGIFFRKRHGNNALLIALAGIVAVISTWFLGNEIWEGLPKEPLAADSVEVASPLPSSNEGSPPVPNSQRVASVTVDAPTRLPDSTTAPVEGKTLPAPRLVIREPPAIQQELKIEVPAIDPPESKRPPLDLSPSAAAEFSVRQPSWQQVLARFPHLEQLYNRGSRDLCARCIVSSSGYLGDCEVAGEAASDPAVRQGARQMISLIYVTLRDGRSAEGRQVGVPIHFGRSLPPPPGGYCSNPEADFR